MRPGDGGGRRALLPLRAPGSLATAAAVALLGKKDQHGPPWHGTPIHIRVALQASL